MSDIMEGFTWHSAIGVDDALGGKRFVTRLRRTRNAMGMFVAAGNNFLVHKTTKCLWRFSDDGKHIEPVFSNDVLTEEDVEAVTSGKEKE